MIVNFPVVPVTQFNGLANTWEAMLVDRGANTPFLCDRWGQRFGH